MLWIQAQKRTLYFFSLWVFLFWMNGLKWFSLQRMGMWEVCVFLSPGNSCLASGIVLLAWFFTLPSYWCNSRHSFRDWITLLKCYWCVKLVWNWSLATRVSSLGVRKQLSASINRNKYSTLSETSARTSLSAGEVRESQLVNKNHQSIASAFIYQS